MTGATATAIGVSVAGSVASAGVSDLIGGGGGGGGGTSGGGGGLNISQQQYVYHGPHPSTTPLQGTTPPKSPVLSAPKAGRAEAATERNLRSTPSQAVGEQYAAREYQNMWADRLSKYLDYNTRSLG